MRKLIVLIAALAIIAGLVIGMADTASAASDHSMTQNSIINICTILNPGGGEPGGWAITYWRHVEYGTAYVVQCAYTLYVPGMGLLKTCRQYVWGPGVPQAYWLPYNPVSPNAPWCW